MGFFNNFLWRWHMNAVLGDGSELIVGMTGMGKSMASQRLEKTQQGKGAKC